MGDLLKHQAHQAKTGGSFKTQHNTLVGALKFVDTLREAGIGVQKWSNVHNGHVAEAVEIWQQKGLSSGTIKNYLSAVRETCRAWGNERIRENNASFGVVHERLSKDEQKADLSVTRQDYERILAKLDGLGNQGDTLAKLVGAQVRLMANLGLRGEEARKFEPAKDVLQNGDIRIAHGAKNGRERTIEAKYVTREMREAIEHARAASKEAGNGKNLLMRGDSGVERKMVQRIYRLYRKLGLTKNHLGTGHGFRHGFVQRFYEKQTGVSAPCKFQSRTDFRQAMWNRHGDNWKKIDQDARLLLKSMIGHGPDRNTVMNTYLGRS